MMRSLFLAMFAVVPVTATFAQMPAGESKYEAKLQKLVEIMGQMSKTLEAVVDEETAKANRSTLRAQTEAFVAARKQSLEYAPPTPEEREKLAQKFRPEIEKQRKVLVGQIARVQRVPGGEATLQELRSVFEKGVP